jgi:hypothetical protein
VQAHGNIGATNADGSGGTLDMNGASLNVDYVMIDAAQWNLTTPAYTAGPHAASTFTRVLSNGTSVTVNTTGKDGTRGDINVISNVRWSGDASLTLNASHSTVVGQGMTIANAGAGNLTLRADANGIDNGGSTINRGTLDWSHSTGVVSVLHDMNGTYTPGTVRANPSWVAAPYSGLLSQFTTYRLVNTGADLANVSNDLAGTYALGRNVTLTAAGNAGIGVATQSAFTGQFDGRGHTIAGFSIGDLAGATDADYVGLFAIIGPTGIVRNLSVNGAAITEDNTRVGLLAGLNRGTLVNVHTSGSVTDQNGFFGSVMGGLVSRNEGTIERSSSAVDLSGQAGLGGLVGENAGVINQSFASGGAFSGSHGSGVGGLAMSNTGTITQSYATGETQLGLGDNGGFVADNSGTIQESFSTGHVTLFGPSPIGGFIGVNSGPISNDFWDIETSGKTVGVNGSGAEGATGLTTAQMSAPPSFGSQWNFGPNGTWVIPAGYTHPILRWQLQIQ